MSILCRVCGKKIKDRAFGIKQRCRECVDKYMKDKTFDKIVGGIKELKNKEGHTIRVTLDAIEDMDAVEKLTYIATWNRCRSEISQRLKERLVGVEEIINIMADISLKNENGWYLTAEKCKNLAQAFHKKFIILKKD